MTLLTVSALGGVIFAYGQEAPSLAVAISFVTLMLNFTMSAYAGLISVQNEGQQQLTQTSV